jgi:cysteine desulfuration protein SufE
MYQSCIDKQEQLKALFASCADEEAKYQLIINMGRELPGLPAAEKIPSNIVKGCQSTVFLSSKLSEGVVIFGAESDALISSGLAAVLLKVYSGESPETILKCPPAYLDELGISASLTPGRANGLYSIHLRMKQEALGLYMQLQKD